MEGVRFITMELVSGKTLSELIPKHGMPLGKFFEVAVPLADAVSAAHEDSPDRDGSPQRVRPSGEDVTPLPVSGGSYFRWSPDSTAVYFVAKEKLWVASIESGQERRLTDLDGKPGEAVGVSIDTDGEYVCFTWQDDVGDIWVMDVAPE